VAVVSVGSPLAGDPLWALFAGAVALLPSVAHRSAAVMPPWEVILIAALPVLGRLFATTLVTGQIATYLAVAALALLVSVDLVAFTPVRMSEGFALLFVVLATMAAAGVWAVVRYLADLTLGTGFIGSEHALMVEFVASTVVGYDATVTVSGGGRSRTARVRPRRGAGHGRRPRLDE
jgi:hypothetical protein